jgi:hypothetical protein
VVARTHLSVTLYVFCLSFSSLSLLLVTAVLFCTQQNHYSVITSSFSAIVLPVFFLSFSLHALRTVWNKNSKYRNVIDGAALLNVRNTSWFRLELHCWQQHTFASRGFCCPTANISWTAEGLRKGVECTCCWVLLKQARVVAEVISNNPNCSRCGAGKLLRIKN